jgi:hypothetical protein
MACGRHQGERTSEGNANGSSHSSESILLGAICTRWKDLSSSFVAEALKTLYYSWKYFGA